MRVQTAAVCGLLGIVVAESNLTVPQSSQQILAGDFRPPQVFENVNVVRNTNLEKGFVRETINVVVKNVDKEPQTEYYLPFQYDVMGKVGGLQVQDKKQVDRGIFAVKTAALATRLEPDGIPSPWVTWPRSRPEY